MKMLSAHLSRVTVLKQYCKTFEDLSCRLQDPITFYLEQSFDLIRRSLLGI